MNPTRPTPSPRWWTQRRDAARAAVAFVLLAATWGTPAWGQEGVPPPGAIPSGPGDEGPLVPAQVEVEAVSSDAAIDRRLTGILRSTSWFEEVDVAVRDGVVFLDGRTESPDYRKWAGELAGKTRDVVAVVNRIRVATPSAWNLRPAVDEVTVLWEGAVRQLPLWGFSS